MVNKEIRFAPQRAESWEDMKVSGLQTSSCARSMGCELSCPLSLEFRREQSVPRAGCGGLGMEAAGMSCAVRALAGGDEACPYPRDALTLSPPSLDHCGSPSPSHYCI